MYSELRKLLNKISFWLYTDDVSDVGLHVNSMKFLLSERTIGKGIIENATVFDMLEILTERFPDEGELCRKIVELFRDIKRPDIAAAIIRFCAQSGKCWQALLL